MKSSIRGLASRRVLAMLVVGAAWSALPSAHAAAGDAGTRDYAAEDKLLGGPSTSGGYADPYGQAPTANGKGAKNGAKAATAKLVQQYDSYKPFPDLAVNGQLTLSENLADLAGLSAAYDAYRTSSG